MKRSPRAVVAAEATAVEVADMAAEDMVAAVSDSEDSAQIHVSTYFDQLTNEVVYFRHDRVWRRTRRI